MKHFHQQFTPMSKAYESLKNTISIFKDEKKDIDIMCPNKTGIHISNPLEFGCAWEIEKLSNKMRLEFVTYIISVLSTQDKFKNLMIDERSLINHFDNNDTAFDPSDVVEYFDNQCDSNDLTVRVYNQILTTARRSLPWNLGKQTHEVERFGKDSSGIILSFHRGHLERNTNTTTELIKLLRIIYCDRNPLYVTAMQLDIGDTLTQDDLGFCENMRAYQNGKLKIKFETKERADEVCDLLLGD